MVHRVVSINLYRGYRKPIQDSHNVSSKKSNAIFRLGLSSRPFGNFNFKDKLNFVVLGIYHINNLKHLPLLVHRQAEETVIFRVPGANEPPMLHKPEPGFENQ
jgi:hypothetical protein